VNTGADKRPQLIQFVVAVVDLLEKARPEQLAELSRVDLIRLRSVTQQPVAEWITGDDPLRIIQ
jgi:hypothetical protein